jgi:hypothetical protein
MRAATKEEIDCTVSKEPQLYDHERIEPETES